MNDLGWNLSRFYPNLTVQLQWTHVKLEQKSQSTMHTSALLSQVFPKARVKGKIWKCSKLGYVILIAHTTSFLYDMFLAIAMCLKVGNTLSFLYSISSFVSLPSFLPPFFLSKQDLLCGLNWPRTPNLLPWPLECRDDRCAPWWCTSDLNFAFVSLWILHEFSSHLYGSGHWLSCM